MREAYRLMRARHGHQHWWPGDTPFEVCIGAILTQNTSWSNVERALANLKAAGSLDPRRMHSMTHAELARLVRPAGCFNVKAKRVREFLKVLVGQFEGSLERLFAGSTEHVRARLLAINGIGPETADSMLLYAGGHLSFVVDAYARRIFLRHGWCDADVDYHGLQKIFSEDLQGGSRDERLDLWQDYHAQLVMVGKQHCRAREAQCAGCPLEPLLPERWPAADLSPRGPAASG